MTTVSRPKITVTKLPQSVAVENEEQRVLLLGQMISGTATAGALTTSIGNAKEEDALFGARSQIAGMARAFREVNQKTRLDAIPLADNGSTKATAVVTFTGTTATESGTITVVVGSRKKHSYELAITSGDTITEIGDLLVTAITADTNAPFTATNASGTVTITASNAGTEANSFGIEYDGLVAGVTTTLTGWTGGATDPVLTGVFDVIENERYQHIIYPSSYEFDFMEDFLDARWNVVNDIKDGQAYTTITDTLANLRATGALLNSKNLTVIAEKPYDETKYKGSAMMEIDYQKSAAVAGVISLRLTKDAPLSQILSVKDAQKDVFGGVALAGLPIHNTLLKNLSLNDTGKGWTADEIDELNELGFSVIGNNTAGNNVITDQIRTMYKTDVAGNPDPIFGFLNPVQIASNVAEYIFNNLKSDLAQIRMTEGVTAENRAIADKNFIRQLLLGYFDTLSGDDYLLLQGGAEQRKIFADNLAVEFSLLAGKVTITSKANMIAQLREVLMTTQFGYSAE